MKATLTSHARLRAARRGHPAFTLLDLVVTLVILTVLLLLATATLLQVINTSKNNGATATALSAASDAVSLASQQNPLTNSNYASDLYNASNNTGFIFTACGGPGDPTPTSSFDPNVNGETKGCTIARYPAGSANPGGLEITSESGYLTVVYDVYPSYGGSATVTISFPEVIGGTPILGFPPGNTGPTIPGTPSTPTPVVVINNYSADGDTMSWSWAPSTGGTAPYTYYWSISPTAGSTCTSGSALVTSVTCSNIIVPGATYTFSVYAQSSGTTPLTSGVGSVTATAAEAQSVVTSTASPSATSPVPVVPVVTANTYNDPDGTMTWAWPASSGGTGALSYFWSLSPTTSGCSAGETSSTTFTCSSVTPGTTYTYTVFVQDNHGDTSEPSSVTATAAGPPPTGPTTTLPASSPPSTPQPYVNSNTYGDTYDTVQFAWDASTGGTSPYTYYWTISPGSPGCVSGSTTSLTLTCSSLAQGATYTLNVQAEDANSTYSSWGSVSVTTISETQLIPPTTIYSGPPPTTPTTTPGGSYAPISTPQPYVTINSPAGLGWNWSPVTGGNGIYTYYWTITPGPTGCASGASNSTGENCYNVSPGSTYQICVFATDSDSNRSSTGCDTETVPSAQGGGGTGSSLVAPDVTNVSASAGQAGATVSWSDYAQSGITSVRVVTFSQSGCSSGLEAGTQGYASSPSSGAVQTSASFTYKAGVTYYAQASADIGSTPTGPGNCFAFVPQAPPINCSTLTNGFSANTGGAVVTWACGSAVGVTSVTVEVYSNSSCTSGLHSAGQTYTASANTTSGSVSVIGPYSAGSTYWARVNTLSNSAGAVGPGQCVSYTIPGVTTTTIKTGGGTTTTTTPPGSGLAAPKVPTLSCQGNGNIYVDPAGQLSGLICSWSDSGTNGIYSASYSVFYRKNANSSWVYDPGTRSNGGAAYWSYTASNNRTSDSGDAFTLQTIIPASDDDEIFVTVSNATGSTASKPII
jgi:type II secretory pathway pseudopilin PulG